MSRFVNREEFFDGARKWIRNYTKKSMNQKQVDGLNNLLDVWEEFYLPRGYDWRYFVACVGQSAIETGWTFQPIFERGGRSYFNKYDIRHNPKKARVLGNDRPGDGYLFRGAGHVQNTGKRNAIKSARELNSMFGTDFDFVKDPDSRADPFVSAHCLFLGCIEGWWTGRKLGHYIDDFKTDYKSARRVVNGTDKWVVIGNICKSLHTIVRDSMVTEEERVAAKAAAVEERKRQERKVARAADGPAELRKESRISRKAHLGKFLAWLKGIFGTGATVFAGVNFVDTAKTGTETATNYGNLFEKMGLVGTAATGAIALVTILAIVQAITQSQIEKYRLEMHKDGETD